MIVASVPVIRESVVFLNSSSFEISVAELTNKHKETKKPKTFEFLFCQRIIIAREMINTIGNFLLNVFVLMPLSMAINAMPTIV